MELSLTNVGSENMHVYDSEKDSRIQLVFIPGVFSPQAWKYQIKYFSEEYRAITFRPTVSNRGYEGHKKCLKQILEREEFDRTILIGANYTNPLIQSFEDRENVEATVMVGAKKQFKKEIPKELYKTLTSQYFPNKISKKLLFSSMNYRDAKEFMCENEYLKFKDFQTFQQKYGLKSPGKSCLVVHGERDWLSDKEYIQELRRMASVTVMDAGPFSFYEKPQEFNKTLKDFLIKLERKAIQKNINQKKEENKTLEEFEKKLAKVGNP
jgi:hypothetical protein